jgi:hypothetical protein
MNCYHTLVLYKDEHVFNSTVSIQEVLKRYDSYPISRFAMKKHDGGNATRIP